MTDAPLRKSFHKHEEPHITEASRYDRDILDELEPLPSPEDDLRDARLRYLGIIEDWGRMLHAVIIDGPTIERLLPACLGPAFALGLSCLNGLGMVDVENRFGVSRATISKAAVRFAERHALPPSRYMKAEESRAAYSQSRIEQVKQSQALPMPPFRGRSV